MSDKFWEDLERVIYRGAIKQAKLEKDVADIAKEKYALHFTRDEMQKLYRILNLLHDKQHFFDRDTTEFFFEVLNTIENKLGID
jgi:hypothetical protein